MFPRHLGYEFAILAAVCALGIFLFPATSGPYSAVHGPVTALLSARAKLKLCSGLAIAGLSLRWHLLLDGCAALSGLRENVGLPKSVSPEQISVLRC